MLGAAWAAPVVALSAAAPTVSASESLCELQFVPVPARDLDGDPSTPEVYFEYSLQVVNNGSDITAATGITVNIILQGYTPGTCGYEAVDDFKVPVSFYSDDPASPMQYISSSDYEPYVTKADLTNGGFDWIITGLAHDARAYLYFGGSKDSAEIYGACGSFELTAHVCSDETTVAPIYPN